MQVPGWFRKKGQSPAQASAIAAIRGWIRTELALTPQASIAVNEIVCADPACPGTETVILIMVPGEKTKALKVGAALTEVTETAVAAAVAGLSSR